MNKKICIFLGLVFIFLVSCFKEEFKLNGNINLITREQGSGTRGAFKEIFELEIKNEGYKKDMISKEAAVENNTNTIIQTVKNDKHSVGYISLGSVNDGIKVLSIDNALPNLENIQKNKYNIVRNFNIVIKEDLKDLAKDFVEYILSKQGQKIVLENSYIPIITDKEYTPKNLKGKLVIGGSSSVAPLLEKLIEEYMKINKNSNVELQISDSSTGITKTIENVYDIGISSRNLDDNEKEKVKEIPIAIDAIIIIVNKENSVNNLTKNQVKNIYLGNITKWSEVKSE